jgi:hypothetical protein
MKKPSVLFNAGVKVRDSSSRKLGCEEINFSTWFWFSVEKRLQVE